MVWLLTDHIIIQRYLGYLIVPKTRIARCAFSRRIRIWSWIIFLALFKWDKYVPKLWEKTCFDGFYQLKYFEYISTKTKAFRKFLLIKMLRIKSSTNILNFIKIWNYFLYTVVEILRKYPPTNRTFSFPTVCSFPFLTPPRNYEGFDRAEVALSNPICHQLLEFCFSVWFIVTHVTSLMSVGTHVLLWQNFSIVYILMQFFTGYNILWVKFLHRWIKRRLRLSYA